MKRKLLVLLLFTASLGHVFAQKEISGKVTSSEDGSTLPGVNVIIVGTQQGSVTDLDGNYTVSVGDDASLQFSYIGYSDQTIQVGSQSIINISLVPDLTQLDEIVVTAFGMEREKKSLGYAVAEVESKAITRANTPNLANALYGQAPGVQVSGTSGGVTGAVNVVIRGNSSITGFNQPLFVVDGIPIAHDNGGYGRWGGGNLGGGINDINPEDIESMTVLKGGNAAALYGSQAANGVVLITTKKGKKNEGLGIEFTTSYTNDQIAFVPDFQNKYGAGYGWPYLAADNDGYFNLTDGVPTVRNAWASFGPEMTGQNILWWDGEMRDFTPQPDNYKDMFKNGHTSSSTISVSNSNDIATFRLAYTYFDNAGIFDGSTQKRNVFALNTNVKISKRLSTDVSLSYNNIVTKNVPPPTGGLNAYEFPRSTKTDLLRELYEDDQGFRRENDQVGQHASHINPMNMLWGANKNNIENDKARIIGNITLNYNILDGLNLRLRGGMDQTDVANDNQTASTRSDRPSGGYSVSNSKNTITYLESILSYNKDLGEDFSLSLTAGAISNRIDFKNSNVGTNGGLIVPNWFSLANSVNTRNSNGGQESERFDAVFGQGQLAYRNMLFLDFTGRNDWSSTLPPESNSYFYPSVSLSWAFSEAFSLPEWFTFGKVRASWAQVGNDAQRYQANKVYNYGSFNGATTNTFSANVPPVGLLPERQNTTEFGTDLRFLDNRVGLDLTYYVSRNFDLIMGLAVAPSTGANNVITNVGEMKNSGVEIALITTPIRTSDFQWDLTFNYAKNRNEVVQLAKGIEELNMGAWSSPMFKYARPGRPSGDWMTYTYLTNEDGRRVIGANGQNVRDDSELVNVGNATPDWTGGIVNNMRYKNFNLSFLIDASWGGDMFSFTNYYGINAGKFTESLKYRDEENGGLPYYQDASTGQLIQLESHSSSTPNGEIVRHDGLILDGVTENGEENTQLIAASNYYLDQWTWNYGFHEEGLYDNSYVKFRELSFGYTFPESIIGNTFIQNLTLNFIGRNLFFIYKNIPNIDPESSIGTDNARFGYDNSSYPSVRNLGFSLKANF